MIIAAVVALVMFQTPPSWRIVAISGESIDAVDTSTIRRESGGASYSVAHVYPDLGAFGTKFSIVRYWSDCRGRNATMLTIQSYNEDGVRRPPTGANNLPITDPIAPASAMTKLERAACIVNYPDYQMPAINSTASLVRTADAMF